MYNYLEHLSRYDSITRAALHYTVFGTILNFKPFVMLVVFIFLIVHAQRTLTAAAAVATCGFVIPSSHYPLPTPIPFHPETLGRFPVGVVQTEESRSLTGVHPRTHTLTHVHNIHIIFILIYIYIYYVVHGLAHNVLTICTYCTIIT